MKLLDIQLNLKILYNSNTDEIEILTSTSKILNKEDYKKKKWQELKVTETMINYGLLTLGSRSEIDSLLKKGEQLQFNFIENDSVVFKKEITTHKTVGGRVDKLKEWFKLYPNIKPNTILLVNYEIQNKILQVKIK